MKKLEITLMITRKNMKKYEKYEITLMISLMFTINYYRCLIISQNILFSLTNHQNVSFRHS
jgi:hypothetical protein